MKTFLIISAVVILAVNTFGLFSCLRVGGRHERD
jgi:hypothetical protein